MGRAIVRRPQVFPFDEPLSNLDAALRQQMRVELLRLHRQLGTTTIYVTHDQVEAMTLAHRIAVLRQGRLEQIGAPRELLTIDRAAFVARFFGTPEMNLVPGRDPRWPVHAAAGGIVLPLPGSPLRPATLGCEPRICSYNPRTPIPRPRGAWAPVCSMMIEDLGSEALAHVTVGGIG